MVEKQLKSLDINKSAGPDNIHPCLLKEAACEIVPALSIPFQHDHMYVTSQWKLAYIPPIFKKGDRSKAEVYRSISLTSAVANVLERIVNDALFQHLVTNEIISNRQNSFLPVETLDTYLQVTQLLDKYLLVDLFLLDLAKAFNNIPHNQLRFKLVAVGIHHELVDWLMEFLAGRSQAIWLFTTYSKFTNSQHCNVLRGAHQGTV